MHLLRKMHMKHNNCNGDNIGVNTSKTPKQGCQNHSSKTHTVEWDIFQLATTSHLNYLAPVNSTSFHKLDSGRRISMAVTHASSSHSHMLLNQESPSNCDFPVLSGSLSVQAHWSHFTPPPQLLILQPPQSHQPCDSPALMTAIFCDRCWSFFHKIPLITSPNSPVAPLGCNRLHPFFFLYSSWRR